jgi:hypothetical protein
MSGAGGAAQAFLCLSWRFSCCCTVRVDVVVAVVVAVAVVVVFDVVVIVVAAAVTFDLETKTNKTTSATAYIDVLAPRELRQQHRQAHAQENVEDVGADGVGHGLQFVVGAAYVRACACVEGRVDGWTGGRVDRWTGGRVNDALGTRATAMND